jgi:maleylpyruvate isomerase
MRVREVWVHAVDLNIDTSFDDVPHDVCAPLVDDVAASFPGRPDRPSVRLRSEGGAHTWLLGDSADVEPVVVSGDLPSLAAYATGRPVPGPLYPTGGGSLPKLPAWL